ncbi:MAG: hypothetical protein ACLTWR_01275 [Agathobaculum desmolans]|uniref:hypothetical protein n=1 Tax=Agathobaculum desmolans TaxID=39484 RepID=UPI003995DB61
MNTLSIDIETYSDIPLQKTGVYRYCESPNFEILLFGYIIDSGPVQVVDLACGEHIPKEVLAALEDDSVIKWAFNAAFERVCLSRYLGYPTGEYLDPESWHCSMVWAATMGLPLSLEGVGVVLGLEKQKIDGAVATIMGLDRAIRCGNDSGASVYDSRGILFI